MEQLEKGVQFLRLPPNDILNLIDSGKIQEYLTQEQITLLSPWLPLVKLGFQWRQAEYGTDERGASTMTREIFDYGTPNRLLADVILGRLLDEIGIQKVLREQLERFEDLCTNFAQRFEHIPNPQKNTIWNLYQVSVKLRDTATEILNKRQDIWLKAIFPDPEDDD